MLQLAYFSENFPIGKKKVAEILIQNGIDVNKMDHNNQTALHRAALRGNCTNWFSTCVFRSSQIRFIAGKKRVADLLVKNNATIDVVDIEGQTPLKLAANKGIHSFIVKHM